MFQPAYLCPHKTFYGKVRFRGGGNKWPTASLQLWASSGHLEIPGSLPPQYFPLDIENRHSHSPWSAKIPPCVDYSSLSKIGFLSFQLDTLGRHTPEPEIMATQNNGHFSLPVSFFSEERGDMV